MNFLSIEKNIDSLKQISYTDYIRDISTDVRTEAILVTKVTEITKQTIPDRKNLALYIFDNADISFTESNYVKLDSLAIVVSNLGNRDLKVYGMRKETTDRILLRREEDIFVLPSLPFPFGLPFSLPFAQTEREGIWSNVTTNITPFDIHYFTMLDDDAGVNDLSVLIEIKFSLGRSSG